MTNATIQARDLLRFGGRKRLQLVLQNEAAECGLACIAMIAGYHGAKLSLHTLRQSVSVTLRGATLNHLIQIAGGLGMSARPLRLELEHLRELKLPCILHWNQSHFVVLKSVRADGITILDPAGGERRIPMRDVNTSFTGIALELTPLESFRTVGAEPQFSLSQLWSRVTGLWSSMGQILALSFAILAFSLLSPYYMQLVVDEAISSRDISLLDTLAIGFSVILVVQVAIMALRSLVTISFSNQLSIQIASNLFSHLVRLPISFFEKRHVGDIASRFVSLDRVREQLTTTVIEALIDGLLVTVMLVMMWFYSGTLTAVVLGSVVLYFLLRFAFHRSLHESMEEQIVASAKRDSSLIETIRGMQGIKLSRREFQRLALWQNHFADALNAGIRNGKVNAWLAAANQLIFGLEKILVVYLAAKLIMSSNLTIGGLLAFIAYKTQFTEKASGLVDKWQQLRLTRIHLDRVGDIVLTQAESVDLRPLPRVESEARSGHLELQDVHFRYGDTDPFVLKGVNLKVKPGESVAIVGESGQGKTTLLKVLLGLIEPTEGTILIDERDIWAQGNSTLRESVAAVMQDELPLSGTIADNIAFFDEVIDLDRVYAVAMAAGLHADVMRMPMQYQTLIGDMGSSLSGGQRQRLLIARALYRQPKIIVMDEATSNLDVMTERLVSASIKALDITRILVAHRPETIRSADRIVVIEGGQLQEVPREMVVSGVETVVGSQAAVSA